MKKTIEVNIVNNNVIFLFVISQNLLLEECLFLLAANVQGFVQVWE
jgi:hypothetical protein